jgi:hypothetical protein
MTEPTVDADAFNAFEAAGWERQAAGYEDCHRMSVYAPPAGPLVVISGVAAGS